MGVIDKKIKTRGSKKPIIINGLEMVNDECRECLYWHRNKCNGRYDLTARCLFAKTTAEEHEEQRGY